MSGPDIYTLRGSSDDRWAAVQVDDRRDRAHVPVCIRGVDRNRVYLTEEMALHLLEILQRRYPLQAMADA
ncbi:MAG: hypothetical protein AB7L09_02775 [Nitrospira sp.]